MPSNVSRHMHCVYLYTHTWFFSYSDRITLCVLSYNHKKLNLLETLFYLKLSHPTTWHQKLESRTEREVFII